MLSRLWAACKLEGYERSKRLLRQTIACRLYPWRYVENLTVAAAAIAHSECVQRTIVVPGATPEPHSLTEKSMTPEILEQRDEWHATFEAGWLAHFQQSGQIDWKRYNRPRNSVAVASKAVDLARARLLLISTAGAYLLREQQPFDAENDLGDYTIRLLPTTSAFADIGYAHTHYDHSAVEADPQVLLPLRHLENMAATGQIGALTPNMISFMGYQPDVSRVLDELIPAVVAAARAEAATAALLVPA